MLKVYAQERCLTEPYLLVVRMTLEVRSENYPDILITFRMDPGMTSPQLADRIIHDARPFVSTPFTPGETTWTTFTLAPTQLWLITRPAGEAKGCRVLRMQLIPKFNMMDNLEEIIRWGNLRKAIAQGIVHKPEDCKRPADLEFVTASGTYIIFENQSEPGFHALSASYQKGQLK
ncbi:hypothetical protein AAVH_09974, partial [Aphelenchoides avenae]